MSGYDECGAKGPKAGVAVPTGGYTGGTTPLQGVPLIDEMGTQAEMAAGVDIDWEGFINEDVMDFDLHIGGDSDDVWPTDEEFAARPDWWPVIYIDNPGETWDPTMMNGRGILIVRGDLELDGGDQWDGIVMVGGKITDNGTGALSGAVISGLNVKLGETVEESSRANGTKTYKYNSCQVENALTQAANLSVMPNTWLDNWAAY